MKSCILENVPEKLIRHATVLYFKDMTIPTLVTIKVDLIWITFVLSGHLTEDEIRGFSEGAETSISNGILVEKPSLWS